MEFEKQAARIAQHRADLITSPERRRGGGAVLADRLFTKVILSATLLIISARDKGEEEPLPVRFQRGRALDSLTGALPWPAAVAAGEEAG